jgi:crotonobetainyl-CoA:carnitine CoA-transferase CaiB-like acyl-CoA transferase
LAFRADQTATRLTARAPVTAQVLSGIRVVEVASWLAGPAAAMLLAEAGADVIKVEPAGGDPTRPLPGFATWNRSKRSVVVDLHADEGRTVLQDLLGEADVLVHSLRPSVAMRAGIGDEQLSSRHPRLVWCSITGWPHGHPDEDRPGYEILTQAATGVMDEEVGTRPGPVFLRFPFGSWNAALLAVIGILARLVWRDATGHGGPVYTSLFQGNLAPMSKHWSRSVTPTPTMSTPTLFKGMNMVQLCRDNLGVVATMSDVTWAEVPLFNEVLAELPADVAANAMLATAEVLKRRDRQEWLDAMWAAGMPTAKVASRLGEAFSDDQVRVNDYVVEVDDPQWGPTVQAGHPFRVDPPLAVQSPAPRLGEHTGDVSSGAPWPSSARPPGADAKQARPGGRRRPLAGIKVLDFGMFLAGPYGPQLMADLGADVVKVEAPTGDRLRSGERIFCGCQRGKRSVAIDLRSPRSRPVLEELVRWADVVHHNLRLPPATLLGLDYQTVRVMNPAVVYCHVSSYGPDGPRRDWPGVDPTSQAVVGWMQEGAGPGNPPRWYRIGMTDDQCAMSSVIGVLLALRRREQTGEGADVRASILGTAILTTSETMLLPDGSIAPYAGMDADQTGLSAGYRIYQGGDGWVAVAAVGEMALERLARVAGSGAADETAIAAAFRSWPVEQILTTLGAAGVPAEPVRTDHEHDFFDSDLYRRLGLSVEYEHPVYGHLEQLGAPFSFGDLEVAADRPPPVLGQHTAEVLSEIGIPNGTVQDLASLGLIVGSGLPMTTAPAGSRRA